MSACTPYASVSAKRAFLLTNFYNKKVQCKCLSPDFILRFK
eukprot:UN08517